VFGADVVVAKREGLAERELQDLLRARREGDLTGCDFLTGSDDAHDLRAHALNGDVEGFQNPGCKAFLLTEKPEQDVFCADVVVLEDAGFLLCEDDDLPGPLCESLEQLEFLTLGWFRVYPEPTPHYRLWGPGG